MMKTRWAGLLRWFCVVIVGRNADNAVVDAVTSANAAVASVPALRGDNPPAGYLPRRHLCLSTTSSPPPPPPPMFLHPPDS